MDSGALYTLHSTLYTLHSTLYPATPTLRNRTDVIVIRGGGSNIKTYEFSGNKKVTQGDSSSGMTITAHYEKYTRMLADFVISGRVTDPQAGTAGLDFGLRASEMSVPTALAVSPFHASIQQNQNVTMAGNISPQSMKGWWWWC